MPPGDVEFEFDAGFDAVAETSHHVYVINGHLAVFFWDASRRVESAVVRLEVVERLQRGSAQALLVQIVLARDNVRVVRRRNFRGPLV